MEIYTHCIQGVFVNMLYRLHALEKFYIHWYYAAIIYLYKSK